MIINVCNKYLEKHRFSEKPLHRFSSFKCEYDPEKNAYRIIKRNGTIGSEGRITVKYITKGEKDHTVHQQAKYRFDLLVRQDEKRGYEIIKDKSSLWQYPNKQ